MNWCIVSEHSTGQVVTVREARGADAPRVSELLERTWHSSYEGLMPSEALAKSPTTAADVSQLFWECTDRRCIIALAEDQTVGFCCGCRDGVDNIELEMLYVDPTFQRRGIGSYLLSNMVRLFPGAASIRLEVLRDNLSAISFYQRHGFYGNGEMNDTMGEISVPVVLMERMIVGSATVDRCTYRTEPQTMDWNRTPQILDSFVIESNTRAEAAG